MRKKNILKEKHKNEKIFNIESIRAASKYSTWKSVKEISEFYWRQSDANRAETFFLSSTLDNIANKFLSAMIYHHFYILYFIFLVCCEEIIIIFLSIFS